VGDGIFKLCERGARGTNAPIEQMADIVSRHYAEHRMDNAVPYPGIPELLDELNRRGLPMGVLSNKPHEHTVPMVRELFNRWRFAAVEGFREKDRAKPDPRSVWDIVETMKLEPENVIFVGDSDTDMKTAVNARCLPVGATWGYRDREDLWNAGAKHLIDQPIQLLDLF
jgi:phosphoglycolate phosphatase